MKLIEGLHAVIVGRVVKDTASSYVQQSGYSPIYRTVFRALAWKPGTEGYEMWAAHTKAKRSERYMEKLTRGESDADPQIREAIPAA